MHDWFEIETTDFISVITVRNEDIFRFEQIQEASATVDRLLTEIPQEKIVIDFSQIKFWNSLAMGFLASKNKKARDLGKELKYCNLSRESMWSVEAMLLDKILDIQPDRLTAIRSF